MPRGSIGGSFTGSECGLAVIPRFRLGTLLPDRLTSRDQNPMTRLFSCCIRHWACGSRRGADVRDERK